MSYDFNRYKQDLERLIKLISDFEIKLKTVFQKYPATLLEERKELQKTLIYLVRTQKHKQALCLNVIYFLTISH